MPIQSGKTAVGTAATVLPITSPNPFLLTVHNNDNTDAVYLGGPDVTAANGLVVNKIETLQFEVTPGDRIWAVSTKTGHNLSWLAITKQF